MCQKLARRDGALLPSAQGPEEPGLSGSLPTLVRPAGRVSLHTHPWTSQWPHPSLSMAQF